MNPSRLSARVSLLEGRLGALCLLSRLPPGEIWSVGGHWDVRGSEGLQSVLEPTPKDSSELGLEMASWVGKIIHGILYHVPGN